MGIRPRGPREGALGSSFMLRMISCSSPMTPKALSGLGHSTQSVGIPARAGESRIIWERCVCVFRRMAVHSVQSQKTCSAQKNEKIAQIVFLRNAAIWKRFALQIRGGYVKVQLRAHCLDRVLTFLRFFFYKKYNLRNCESFFSENR